MKVSVEQLSATRRKLAIELPPDVVASAVEKSFRELARNVQLKGFRPGKAPRSVLKDLYGERIDEDVTGRLVEETFPEALKQESLTPITAPTIEEAAIGEDRSLRYVALVEIRPALALEGYKGLEVKPEPVLVTDDQIDQELESLRGARATRHERTGGDTAARRGDVVVGAVEVTDQGRRVADLSQAEAAFELDPERLAHELLEGLEGVRPGETRTLAVGIPEGHARAEWAGRRFSFEVRVAKVEEKRVPPADDAFAQSLEPPYENLGALRDEMRKRIRAAREDAAKGRQKQELVEHLVGRHTFEVPEGLVEAEARALVRMSHAHEPGSEHDHDHGEEAEAQRWAQARLVAEKRVRADLILGAIADAEGIEVGEEELDQHLARRAAILGQDVTALKAAYRKRGALDEFRAELRRGRVLDFLLENAKIIGG